MPHTSHALFRRTLHTLARAVKRRSARSSLALALRYQSLVRARYIEQHGREPSTTGYITRRTPGAITLQ